MNGRHGVQLNLLCLYFLKALIVFAAFPLMFADDVPVSATAVFHRDAGDERLREELRRLDAVGHLQAARPPAH